MRFVTFGALLLTASLMVLNCANAESTDTKPATQKNESSVLDKVGNAINRGANAAARGIERGVKAAEHGIKVGTKAAVHGVKRGTEAAAKGVEKGANATARVAKKVAGSSEDKEPSRTGPPGKQ